MSDEITRDFRPIKNADKLFGLTEIPANSKVTDSDLRLIKGLNDKRVGYLKELGITTASELLFSGRTADMRRSLAMAIIRAEGIRLTDAVIERYSRYVLSWVRQADLWRVPGMDPDTANALVMLGVRHVDDLSRVDADKVFAMIAGMSLTMPDLEAIDRDSLADLIAAAQNMTGGLPVNQSALRQKLLNTLTLSGSRLPAGMDPRQTKKLLEILSAQLMDLCAGDLFGKNWTVESDDPTPSYLFRDEETGKQAVEEIQVPTVVSLEKIRSGLEAMKQIPRQLNPPRFIRGRVFLLRTGQILPDSEHERMDYVLYDARVELDGTVSPNSDSTENAEKPHAYTDGSGEFVIELPVGSNLCQTMTLTVSQGSFSQKFCVSAEKVLMSCPERKILQDLDTLDRISEDIADDERKLLRLKEIEARMDSKENPPTREDLVFYDAYRGQRENLNREIQLADERMQALASQIRSSDPTTNDLTRILRNLTRRTDLTADLTDTPFIVNESVFRQLPVNQPKVMPSVKLMEYEDTPVYLPTDTAPSQIFQYSMLQRLVEPDIRKNGKELARVSINDALDVSTFRNAMADQNDNLPYMSSLGMGYALNMHQAWVPDGFALGSLLYSLVLAPGEEQRLIVRESKQSYALSDQAVGMDSVGERYDLSQIDNAEAAFNSAMKQMIDASARFSTSSTSWSLGATGGAASFSTGSDGSLGFGGGLSGGIGSASSEGEASSSQTNTHSEASNAAQTFQHGIKMASEKIAQAKRLSISMATSDQQDSVATRIIANHNHSHTMTIQYWEVMRRYRLATCVDSVDLVLFVPLKPITFYSAQNSTRPALPGQRPDSQENTTPVRRPESLLPDSQESTSTRPAVTPASRPQEQARAEVPAVDDGAVCEAFRKQYENITAYYDVLVQALPAQHRAGLEVIRTYSMMDGWTKESAASDHRQLTVDFVGTFLNCDMVSATLELKNGKGMVAGHVMLQKTALSDILSTSDQVHEQIRQMHGWSVKRPDPSGCSKLIFDLPAGISLADIGTIRLNYDCDSLRHTLNRYTSYTAANGESSPEVFEDMWSRLWDRAKDDDDSENDERRIAFYKSILPEAWITPNITVPAEKIRSLGPVCVRIVDVTLGSTPIRHSLDTGDIRAGASVTLYAPTDILTRADQLKAEQTYRHVLSNTMHYSQAVWASLSADERAMLLDQYTIHMDWENVTGAAQTTETDIPLLNCINVHKLLGFYGNCMLFPFTYPDTLAKQIGRTAAQLQDTLYRYHANNFRVPVTTISLPTDGMIGEAVLGATNVSEEIDLTRFWNWKDSPIDSMSLDSEYLNSTDYLKDRKTKDITALNLSGVSQPESVDVYDALQQLLSRENPEFENMTGMDQLKELVNATTTSAQTGRDKAMDAAQQSMKGVLDFTENMKKAENDLVKTLLENGYTPDGKFNPDALKPEQDKPEENNTGTGKPGDGTSKPAAGSAKPTAGTGAAGIGSADAGTAGTNSGSIHINIYNGTPVDSVVNTNPSANTAEEDSEKPERTRPDKVPPVDPPVPSDNESNDNCSWVCEPSNDPNS